MEHVEIAPFQVIGIAIRTTNDNAQAAKEIADLWRTFMTDNVLNKIPNKVDTTVYSLYVDYEDDHTKPYTAMLGCKVETLKEVPAGMVGKLLEGGSYVKITAKGDLLKGLVVNQWSEIFQMPLDRSYVADFEVFGTRAQDPSDAEVDFYVGIND